MRPGSPRAAPRLRRLRRTPALRNLVSVTPSIDPGRLVYPLFVTLRGPAVAAPGLPAMARRDVRGTVEEVLRVSAQGVRAVMLFGVPSRKDPLGKGAWDPQGPVPRAIHALRRALPDLVIMADVCLCEYTDHGHCGVLRGSRVDNDRTLPLLARAAVTYVDAGADVVAPSAMMDHQVHAVREALDSRGFEEAMVLAYAAKFASWLYGPFRDAAGSRPSFGDRRSYQMDPRNAREALRELEQDEAEGADALMVKPALPNLDVLARARRRFEVPLAAYQVSGEYAMIKAAAAQGWLEESRVVPEILTSIQRAGADFILSYFAGELPLPAEETAA